MKNIILIFLAIFFILIITPILNKNRYIVEGASGMIVPVNNTTFQPIYEDFTTIKSINNEWAYSTHNTRFNYGFEPRWNSKGLYPNSLFTTNNNTWYLSSKNSVIYAVLNDNIDNNYIIENAFYYKNTPMKYLKTKCRVFNLFYWRASSRVTPIGNFYTNINITTQGTYSVSFATSFHDSAGGADKPSYINLKVALGSSYIIFNNANVYYVSSGNVSLSAYYVNSSGTSEVSKLMKDNPAINALIGSLGFITLTFTNIPVGTCKLSFGADTLNNDYCGFGISQIEVSYISTNDPPVYSAIQSYLKLRNTNQSVTKDQQILLMIKNLSPYGEDSNFSQKVNTIMTSDNTNEVFKNLGSLFNVNNNAFTPLSITERGGCTNWYDGADPNGNGTIPSNGTIINTWVDKSPHKNNMIIQTAGGGKYVLNSQNGLGAVSFNNTWYRTVTPRASYPIDVFVVVKLDSLTTAVDVIGHGSKTNDSFNSLTYGEYTAGKWHNGSSNFNRTPNAIANNGKETSTGYLLMEWSISNNYFFIYRNGNPIMFTDKYTWTPPSDNELRLGNRIYVQAGNLLQGSIAEVITYDFMLYHYDRFKVEGYLAWKWGLNTLLPIDHPYYSVSI